MWNTKINTILIFLVLFKYSWSQDSLFFFHAKSEIAIERNGEREEFTAHIRYNLKDTLWVSFTGTLGIEGARMLITNDSTYIINKLEKNHMIFSSKEANYIIPYAFSLNDWKTLLLNIPMKEDSASEIVMENEIQITTHYTQDNIRKIYQKNNRILKCQFNNTREGGLCEVVFSQYENANKNWTLAKERQIQVNQPSDSPIKISIRYLNFTFNQPKPFTFNYSKYKNESNQ